MAQVCSLCEQRVGPLRQLTVQNQQTTAGAGLQRLPLPFKLELGNLFADFLGDLSRSGFRAILDEQRKGIAGQSCQGITLSYAQPEHGGQFPQVAVAGAAASVLVELFEVVQIQKQQPVGALAFVAMAHGPFQVFDEGTAIHQPGDRIVSHAVIAVAGVLDPVADIPCNMNGPGDLTPVSADALEVKLVNRQSLSLAVQGHFCHKMLTVEGPLP